MGSPVSGIQVLLSCMKSHYAWLAWICMDIFVGFQCETLALSLSLLRLGYVIALLGIQAYGFSPDKLCRLHKGPTPTYFVLIFIRFHWHCGQQPPMVCRCLESKFSHMFAYVIICATVA